MAKGACCWRCNEPCGPGSLCCNHYNFVAQQDDEADARAAFESVTKTECCAEDCLCEDTFTCCKHKAELLWLNSMIEGALATVETETWTGPAPPSRRRLPDVRKSVTHKFRVGDSEGYVTIGLFDDGTPGEMFIHASKQGSTVQGLLDAFATQVSYSLQYGVPLEKMADKYIGSRFEPSGFTGNPKIPNATSILDYVFKWALTYPWEPSAVREIKNNPEAMAGIYEAMKAEAHGERDKTTEEIKAELFDTDRYNVFWEELERAVGPTVARVDIHYTPSGDICFDCGQEMVYQEGCSSCRACGNSKC